MVLGYFTKKATVVLSLAAALVAIPSFAHAESHNTDKTLIQWGLNGGLTFTVTAKVTSNLSYTTSGPVYQYTYSDANISLAPSMSYGLSACGDTIAIRKQTKFNGTGYTLPTQTSYIVEPGTTIIGYHANSGLPSFLSSFTVPVENYGVVTPDPSKCTGGGSVTDSFNISH